jgi:hypothetical protein
VKPGEEESQSGVGEGVALCLGETW